MTPTVFRESAIAVTMFRRSPPIRVTSEAAAWLESAPAERLPVGDASLVRWETVHLDALCEAVLSSLPHLLPWMGWAHGFDRASAAGFLASADSAWDARTDFQFGLWDRDGRVLGSFGLHTRLGVGGLEIGYWLRPSETGRGLATRAAAVVTTAGLGLAGVDRVEIHHDRANERSGRIPARLGYSLVGEEPRAVGAPGHEGVERIWRLTAAQFPGSEAARITAVGGA